MDHQLDVYNESKLPYTQEQWDINLNQTATDENGNIADVIKAYLYGWS